MNRNTPEPTQNGTKKSLLARIVEGETPTPTDTTPRPTRKKRTAPKVRTKRNDPETEKQYKRWAKRNDPDQQCKRYLKKYWGA